MDNRVFVSSTTTDLIKYRECVRDVIRQLGANDISMENFGARDERPKDECLRLIREESDLFVGIYAHRYGSIPDKEEKSITESEYDAATISGLPRFIYLVDEKTPWIPEYIEKGNGAKKLGVFKKRLKADHICKFFTDENQLAAFVAADLGRYLSVKSLMNIDAFPDNNLLELNSADEWNLYRDGVYKNNRGIFLTHVITQSRKPKQRFDVFIYLIKHQGDLSEVESAEFFFGRMWKNRIFKVINEKGFVGIATSAYGEYLCTCRVTFNDGYQINISRYIDFETGYI